MAKSGVSIWEFTLHIILGLASLTISLIVLIAWSRSAHLLCAVSQPNFCPSITDDTGRAWHRIELEEDTLNFALNYSLPLIEGRVTRLSLLGPVDTLDLCGGTAPTTCQDFESETCITHGMVPPCGFLRGKLMNSGLGESLEHESFLYQLQLATENHPVLAQCGVWQGSCKK
jgi:hypothetical protein